MAGIMTQALRRYISTNPALRSAANIQNAAQAGQHGGWKMWKNLSVFLAFPAIGLCMLNVYLAHGNHHSRPEFVPYEHLRVRTKRFPWGDGQRSFFHNPEVNPLPTGYEE